MKITKTPSSTGIKMTSPTRLLSVFILIAGSSFAQDVNVALINACNKGDATKAKAAIAKGANVNTTTDAGMTPLLCATRRGNIEIMKFLLEKGADVNAKESKYGQTALILAARGGYTDAVKLLIEKKADLNVKEKMYGQTAVLLAANEEIVDLLKKAGAETSKDTSVAPAKKEIKTVQEAPQAPAEQEQPKKKNLNEELIAAAEKGNIPVVRVLLAEGAPLNAADERGNDALMLAAKSGNAELVKILLEKGASVCGRNVDGDTALKVATAKGNVKIVGLLRDAGAR